MSIEIPQAPAEREDVAVNPQMLMTVGEIISLASQSASHRQYTLEQLEYRFLVPASIDQVRIYRTQIEPIAVVTWALVSDDIHEKMLAERFVPAVEDWNSGDNLWLMEAIMQPTASEMVISDLVNNVFPNKIGHMWVEDAEKGWFVDQYFGVNRQGNAAAAN